MKDSNNREDIIKYLEAIVLVTEISSLKRDAKKLLEAINQSDEITTNQKNKFKIYRSMYLNEQREWEAKQGLGHRVSRYTD